MVARRNAQRQSIREDIKAIARQQMAADGPAGLSLNAIAREMGVAVSGLYRYFDGRDALLTALIVDAFNAHADSMQAHADAAPHGNHSARLMGAMSGYRAWALENKSEFALIYGTPIPSYIAPREVTVPAAQRSLTVIYDILMDAYNAGALKPTSPASPQHYPKLVDTGVPPSVAYWGARGWSLIHGIITLEVFEHLQGLVSDLDGFYRAECLTLITEGGLPPP
jgi:AcrR family transcriptional regulator